MLQEHQSQRYFPFTESRLYRYNLKPSNLTPVRLSQLKRVTLPIIKTERLILPPNMRWSDQKGVLVVASSSTFALGARSTGFATLAALTAPNAAIVGFIGASGFLPWLLLGPFVGHLLDRHAKARMMLLFGCISGALCLLAAGWSEFFGITWPFVLVLSLSLGSLHVIHDTAVNSYLGEIVPEQDLAAVNGQLSAWQSGLSVAAPAVAGIVLGYSSLAFFLMLTAIFGGVAALALKFHNRGKVRSDKSKPGEWRRFNGVRHLWANKGLMTLCSSVSIMNFYSGLFSVLLPLYVLSLTDQGPSYVGLVFAVQAASLLIGVTTAAAFLAKYEGIGRTLLISSSVMKVFVFSFILVSSEIWAVFLACVINGLSAGLWNAPSSTAMIRGSAGSLQNHIIAAYKMISSIGAPLGALIGGFIGATFGLQYSFLSGLVLAVLVAILVAGARKQLSL